MSDLPFEFSYQGEDDMIDIAKTPELGRLINEWVNGEYDEDEMVFGVLAFSEDKELVGVHVVGWGDPDGMPQMANPDEPWTAVMEWLDELGVVDFFTFVRRGASYGHGATPGSWDQTMAMATTTMAREEGKRFQGHIITTGTEHAIVTATPLHNHTTESEVQEALSDIVDRLDTAAKLMLARNARETIIQHDGDNVDPDVLAALDLAIAHYEDGGNSDPSEENLALIDRAMETLQERLVALQNGDPSAGPRADQPKTTDSGRPDVPGAFYDL